MQYSPHKYCLLFPVPSKDQERVLGEDIREYGLLEAITLFKGKILDGRNRYSACLATDTKPRFTKFKGTAREALAFVISKNLARRHLSVQQRAAVAAELATMRGGRPSKTVPDGTVSLEDAATTLNVGRTTAAKAKKVKAEDPDTFQKIKDGDRGVSLNKTYNDLTGTDTKPDHRAAVRRACDAVGSDQVRAWCDENDADNGI